MYTHANRYVMVRLVSVILGVEGEAAGKSVLMLHKHKPRTQHAHARFFVVVGFSLIFEDE